MEQFLQLVSLTLNPTHTKTDSPHTFQLGIIMTTSRKLLILIGLLIISGVVSAQNKDILWQKTLTKDTIPISSIAIAEGKYVAALKGNEIVILDYNTGDSIKTFPKPADMYGTDIILGKNGERLYIMRAKPFIDFYKNVYSYLTSWDIASGIQFNDTIRYYSLIYNPFRFSFYKQYTYSIKSSLDGRYILISCSFEWEDITVQGQVNNGSDTQISLYNVLTGTIVHNIGSKNEEEDTPSLINFPKKSIAEILGGQNSSSTSFSPSGNYYQFNYSTSRYQHTSGGYSDIYENKQYSFINSTSSQFSSYKYNYQLPFYIFSSNDNFVLEKNYIKDIPPAHTIRTLTKTGFVFLPDDNHMLAFKSAGGVAAISNIEKDTWEKVYQGDSLTENIIQTNASRSAFATATNNRITFWQVPNTLEPANLIADFEMSKDSILIYDTISFTNRTFPIQRGSTVEWDFGDGTAKSKEPYPTHMFNTIGKFTVSLQIWDTNGRTSTATKTVVVSNYKLPDMALWINRINENTVNCITYSSNGQLISSGSYGSAVAWNSKTGEMAKSIYFKAFTFSTIFTKNGESIAVGTLLYDKATKTSFNYRDKYQNNMSIWNLTTDSIQPILTWNVIEDNNLAYIDIKQFSAVSDMSNDNTSYITGHRIIVDWCSIDPRIKDFSKYLTTNQYIGNLLTYNFNTKIPRFSNAPVSGSHYYFANSLSKSPPVYSIRVLANNQHYASIVETRYNTPVLLLRDIASDTIYRLIPTTATSMHFSPDKFHLLTNTGLWNIYDSILIKNVDLPSVFEYHPDGIHVFALRADSTIGIYNLNSNSYEYTYPKQPTVFTALAVAPDGKHIATGDKYGYITVWNVPDSLKVSVKVDFDAAVLNRSNIKTKDTIAFSNTTLPANNTYDFFWTFGDGTTSNERTPKHTFTKAGTFTVTLTAFQNGKAVDGMSKKSYITITGTNSAEEPKVGFEPRFRIVPNPSYGELSINYTLTQPSNIQITITDVLGREVGSWSLQEQAGDHSIGWDSTIGAGMYYCTFRVGSIVHTEPFVVLQ